MPYDENVNCDAELLAQRMLSTGVEGWQDFLAAITRANAARFGMRPEWADEVKTRMEAADPLAKPDTPAAMEERFLLLYPLS